MNLSPYRTTVVTAAASTEMTTVATMRRELGTVTAADVDIRRWIQQQSAAALRHLDRRLAKETALDVFRADRHEHRTFNGVWRPIDALLLSEWPVSSLVSVVEDGVTLDLDADVELDADRGWLWRLDGDSQIAWSSAKISVTRIAGYEMIDELPQDLERAVIIMVKSALFAAARDPTLKQESVPGVLENAYWVGAVGENPAIPPEALALLDPYRRIAV